MNLWDSQTRTITRLSNLLKQGYKRPVVVSPTGSGKTRIATHILKMIQDANKSSIFLAPRRELIYQTIDTFTDHGIDAGVIMAGEAQRLYARCQVASFDTLHARAFRKKKIIMPPADFVVVDEAHLSMSRTKLQIMQHYADRDSKIIGLTATPARGDGTGLGEFYDSLVNEVTVRELIDAGILVEPEYWAPTEFDLKGVRSNKDDYVVSQLDKAVDQPKLIGDIYDNWKRLAPEKRTVIFCVTRKHARHVFEVFVQNGIDCEYVDGETPNDERKAIFDRVRSGETQVLVNVFVASYGLDIPPLECCVLARPTKNLTLYLQIIGRVLRASMGKESATIIDHTGAIELHGLIDKPIPWSLDGADIREKIKKDKQEKKEPRDIVCKNCQKVFSGQRECPACGFEMVPKGEAVPVHEAELRKVDTDRKAYTPDEKKSWYGQLKTICTKRNYSRGWADHQFKNKFGHWPANKQIPMQPVTAEVLNYVKSRVIAYRKATGLRR